MTLKEFLEALSANPFYLLVYFSLIPLTALIAWLLGRGEGNTSPWKYLYATLIYMVCIPGIFAVGLNIYAFMFERRGIMNLDIYTQLIPVLSMILTIYLITKNADLSSIPGFGRLTGLLVMLLATFGIMWFVDRTRLLAITFIPIQYIGLIFIVLFLVIKFGWGRLFAK